GPGVAAGRGSRSVRRAGHPAGDLGGRRRMTRPHLCHIHPSFGTGGPEVRTAQLIDASVDAFRHTVIAMNGDLSGRVRVRCREEVRFLEAPRFSGRGAGLLAMGRALRGFRPDLVLTYGWGGTDGLLAARLVGL